MVPRARAALPALLSLLAGCGSGEGASSEGAQAAAAAEDDGSVWTEHRQIIGDDSPKIRREGDEVWVWAGGAPSGYRSCERAETNAEIMVIGYVVNGEARAYPTVLLDRHEIVNDVLRPDDRESLLPLWRRGVDGVGCPRQGEVIPFLSLPEPMPLGEWRSRHPETLVLLGGGGPARS